MVEIDDYLENLSRREVIGGITGFGALGGIFYFNTLDISEETREVEQELRQLTQSLENADLADPRSIDQHLQNISNVVQMTEDFLGSSSTDRALNHESRRRRWQSHLSILPGIPKIASEPQIQSRITVIKNALDVLNSFRQGLEESVTVRSHVRDTEIETQYRDQSTETPSIDYPSTERLESQIHSIESNEYGEILRPERNEALAPDNERLVTDLNKQLRIYTVHISGQQTVHQTAQNIVEGVTKREHEENDTARESFAAARQQAHIDVDTELTSYAISQSGPTGREYADVISEYRSAAEQFVQSVDAGTKETQQLFWEGYDHLLNARETFITH